MQHEKFNKPTGLQSRLEGLEGLPGEPAFDNEAVWSRLEQRMEQRPVNKRRYLWWAAACLLLVAVGAALFSYQPQVSQQVEQPIGPAMPPTAKSSDRVSPSVLPAAQPKEISRQPLATKPVRKASIPPGAAYQNASEAAPQSVAVAMPTVPDTQPPTVEPAPSDPIVLAEKPSPKKLKVVHLNDLGKPTPTSVPAGSLLATHTDAPAYRDGRAGISFSRNTSDNLIKISISPTN